MFPIKEFQAYQIKIDSVSSFSESTMSFPSDKTDDTIDKDVWMENLQSLNVTRSDMNKIIMNYLVTG